MTLRVFYIFSEFKPRLLSVRSDEDAERCVKLNFSVTLPEVNSMYLRGHGVGPSPWKIRSKAADARTSDSNTKGGLPPR
jgi:hypothetical protein